MDYLQAHFIIYAVGGSEHSNESHSGEQAESDE